MGGEFDDRHPSMEAQERKECVNMLSSRICRLYTPRISYRIWNMKSRNLFGRRVEETDISQLGPIHRDTLLAKIDYDEKLDFCVGEWVERAGHMRGAMYVVVMYQQMIQGLSDGT